MMKKIVFTFSILLLMFGFGIFAFAAENPTVTLSVNISVSGSAPSTPENYKIELKASYAANPLPDGSASGAYTLIAKGKGTFSFPTIEFTHAGVYRYTVRQIRGTKPRCTYDDTVYNVSVNVLNTTDGGLEAYVTVRDAVTGKKPDKMAFKVYYSSPGGVGGDTPPPDDPDDSPDDPDDPPVDPDDPPVDPDDPPVDPDDPPVDPDNPPVDPDNPPVDPDNPPVDPDNPPVDPDNPPVDPDNPPVDPDNPPVDPDNPPVDPDNPPVDPDNPPVVPVDDQPQTGDLSNIELWLTLMGISVLIILALIFSFRKKKKDRA